MVNSDTLKQRKEILLSKVASKLVDISFEKALDLTIEIKDNELYKRTIFNLAKSLIHTNKKQSIKLINQLSSEIKYLHGFSAYEYAINKDKEKIKQMVTLYQVNCDIDVEYLDVLIEVAISIVEFYPFISKDIYEFLYRKFDTLPDEALDLPIDIITYIAKSDINEALDFLNSIDIEDYKVEVLNNILLPDDHTDKKDFE